mgnify:CR=1 FL=1
MSTTYLSEPITPGFVDKIETDAKDPRFFRFEVKEKSNIYINLTELDTDLDLYFTLLDDRYDFVSVNQNGVPNAFASSTEPGLSDESIFAVLEPGKYHIGIEQNAEAYPNADFKCNLELNAKYFDENTQLSNDPHLTKQWHLFNQGFVSEGVNDFISLPNVDIAAPEAWHLRSDASDIKIAIIDSGIDLTHPDLASNLWTNQEEIAGNGKDDDDNGYVDDLHGWNFKNNTANNVPDSHGTHVAGIAGARGNNGIGVAGVAWSTQIMGLDVFNGEDFTSQEYYAPAIRYAVDNGAKVINMSLGVNIKQHPDEFINSEENSAIFDSLQYAYENDVFISIAAGNEGNIYSENQFWANVGNLDKYTSEPAVFSNIFGNIASVASTESTNNLAPYSNSGTSVSIAAPGGATRLVQVASEGIDQPVFQNTDQFKIYSTLPVSEGSYGYLEGTSMAAPVIAGMAALIRAEDETISATETLAIIRAGARQASELEGKVSGGLTADLQTSMLIASNWVGPDTLTQIGQQEHPIFNLSSLTEAQSIKGSLEITRDASFDSLINQTEIGWYRVFNPDGSVKDVLGNTVMPDDDNYQQIALNSSNIVADISGLNSDNKKSSTKDYTLSESTYLAPYAIKGDNTWFAYADANTDGIAHFKVLEANTFGLEEQSKDNGDLDFDDLVISFASDQIL